MTIGLKKGTVKLVAHSNKWKNEFEKEKERLVKHLGKMIVDIQHIGSTLIHRIKAKPIIDIAAGTRKAPDIKKLINPLKLLGYTFRKNTSIKGRHLFFAKGSEAKRTHYLHIEKFGGQRWKNDLKFRDRLNSNTKLAKRYESLKITLADVCSENRKLYTKMKSKFIKDVIKS